ncbi:hypothetical protein COOONC_28113 [Cooperia oncophora]
MLSRILDARHSRQYAKKTSYDHVTPTTDPGRIFTVFFGLIGIPLMFITAADIGKFLSEIVIRIASQQHYDNALLAYHLNHVNCQL